MFSPLTLLFLHEPRRASKIYPSFPKVDFANRVALSNSPSLLKVAPQNRVAAPKSFEPRRDQIEGHRTPAFETLGESHEGRC